MKRSSSAGPAARAGSSGASRFGGSRPGSANPTTHQRHVNTSGVLSIADIENLFVEKLTEKYQLTARDLQRAFKRFDKDGSGVLSREELTRAIQYYLNGVETAQVQELVKRYDVDGDGEISLEEFCAFLLSRNSANKDDWLTVDHLTADKRPNSKASQARDDDSLPGRRHEDAVYIDETEGMTLEYHLKLLLHQLKLSILKLTHEMRTDGKLSFQDRCGQHFNELAESKARVLLYKAFLPYTQGKNTTLVDFPSFKRVLIKFNNPYCPPPNETLMKHLFATCCIGDATKADPDILVDMMFDKGSYLVNKFGFSNTSKPTSDTGRPENGHGPFTHEATDPPLSISNVPYRFITKKCKTSLATPSNFNLSVLKRSSKLPDFHCSRGYVYGINSSLYSGDILHSLSGVDSQYRNNSFGEASNVVIYSSAALGVIHNIDTNMQEYFEGHTDDISCIAVSQDRQLLATGQIGSKAEVIVWSINEPYAKPLHKLGKGFFSRGVCAVEFSFDCSYLTAISCDDYHTVGVWDLNNGQLLAEAPSANGVPPQVKSMKFSPLLQPTGFINRDHENTKCDMFVTAGERHLKFWSFQRPQTRDNRGANLMNRIYRFGKFKVDAAKVFTCVAFTSPRVRLTYDAEATAVRPSSAAGAGRDDDSLGVCDVLTGGNNGILYLWRCGQCVNAITIAGEGGSVDSLQIHRGSYGNDIAVCGGAGGVVCVLNAYTLEVIGMHNILASVAAAAQPSTESASYLAIFGAPQGAVGRAGSGGKVAARSVVSVKPRPASANRTRPRSASSAAVSTSRAGDIAAGAGSACIAKSTGTKKPPVNAPKDAWVRPGVKEEKEAELALEGVKGSSNVIGLSLVVDHITKRLVGILAVSGFGKAFKLVVDIPTRGGLSGAESRLLSNDTLFYFHYGPVWTTAVMDKPLPDVNAFVTGGDDRWLCLWNAAGRVNPARGSGSSSSGANSVGMSPDLLARVKTPAPIRCLDVVTFFTAETGISKTGYLIEMSIAVGFAKGRISIYVVTAKRKSLENQGKTGLVRNHSAEIEFNIASSATRKDCAEDISDLKFSPNGKMLAVGSHDNYIDIYHHKVTPSAGEVPPVIELKYLKRLRGHTSYITHLDWSADNKLIKSNCGAYELLYWDVALGKQILSSLDTVEADAVWNSQTCVLGFEVMGIWPADSDGTDVNSVDVCQGPNIVASGDDFGCLNIHNFPCVAKSAPCLRLRGHSSHVMSVKFLKLSSQQLHRQQQLQQRGPFSVVSAGGNDCSVMFWTISANDSR